MSDADFKREVLASLARIERRLFQSNIQEEIIMSALDDLTAQVAATVGTEQSALTLIQGIPALIAAAGVDPAKLQALQSQLSTSASALAAAVAASPGTPAVPPAAPTTPAA